ncbi:MAG: sensor histidine kinase [Candidatus Dormibacteraeota bacterium]|nr:sensor histidine kinase [Candidatus Dormibacteraeota bacterium]
MTAPATSPNPLQSFRHEALLYAGERQFLDATERFIRDGIAAGEPTLVVVARDRVEALLAAVGDGDGTVVYADMAAVGANPGRIIPAWRRFVDGEGARGRRLRGIGEPVWAERGAAELVECQRHESLLNLAFAGAPCFWLLCPYDSTTLSPAVIDEARRSHPFVSVADGAESLSTFAAAASGDTLDAPLGEPSTAARELTFTAWSLSTVRSLAAREAARAGMRSRRIADLVLAVNEVATNSVRHGGGEGRFRAWHQPGVVVCDVHDSGRVASPLVDRRQPGADPLDARGLWLVNQLCDLVQLRSSAQGTTVRLHMLGV